MIVVFRGAKDDNPTVIEAPFLSVDEALRRTSA